VTAQPVDVVIVGGGIAGGALGTVLARGGLSVVVLEKQVEYRDRVRGESLQPWGVADAIALGLDEVLLTAGGRYAPQYVRFGDADPETILAGARDLGRLLPGVRGALNFHHPAACAALAEAAAAAGATVARGVGDVHVTPGHAPLVAYTLEGRDEEVPCRLVVGADGRQSAVRAQAGIELRREEPIHAIAGLLVANAPAWPEDLNATATEGDVACLVFPLGRGCHRLYLCFSMEQRSRFAGPGGAARFLDAFHLGCLPRPSVLPAATPAGPCASFPGDDTWAPVPFVEGVVLVGDAAGHSNPLIGQGLSLAMRDVRVLSELLLGSCDWSPAALVPYCEERLERMRRVRYTASLSAEIRATFGPEAERRRRRALGLMASRPELNAWSGIIFTGPESAPAEAFSEDVRRRLLDEVA
jgi:2-polyprenyl-6-methoxyphenol hydroxylase-like FAD-dependent oxidoreductase